MRNRMLAAVSVVLAACAGSEPQPTLSISPSGNQTVTGPVTVTAAPPELATEVTWSLSGPGSLSGTRGQAVTYRPPVPAQPAQTATVTATARGQSATVTFTSQTPQADPTRPAIAITGLSGNVDVTYDQYDIPHIFCAQENDCYAVQGYIQAQDRLFQMDLFRRIARGRLASLIGSAGVDQDTQIMSLLVTRGATPADVKRIEDALAANLDADIRAKLQAFANGVNAYIAFLKGHPTLMPGEYAQLPGPMTPNDIANWAIEDSLALGRLQSFQLSETIEKETGYGLFALTFGPGAPHDDFASSSGRFNSYIRSQQPIRAYTLNPDDPAPQLSAGGGATQNLAPPQLTALARGLARVNANMRGLTETLGSMRNGAGSNNWVVAGSKSESGRAMVANDPHLALQYPPVWHLVAMTAGDGSVFNVLGAVFPGIPGVLVGRGAHVGWGDTVVGYDVTDVYQERLTDCTHPPPLVCGAVEFRDTNGGTINVPITVKPVSIDVKGASPVTDRPVLLVPHHGPIIPGTYDPVSQTAFSVRWTGHEVNTQELKAFLELSKATSVGDDTAAPGTAYAALKNFGVGAQNFVIADDQGNIGYDPHALVPRRDWLSPSQPPWLPLLGHTGTAEWGRTGTGNTACAANPAPADCWVPDPGLPRGVNPSKGYFATANSDPAGFSDDNNPAGNLVGGTLYPYLSFDWSDPTGMRYARIAEMLKAFTTSGDQKVSVQEMQQVQGDHSMLLARLFEDRGFYPPNTGAPPAYATGRALLATWASANFECPTGLAGSDPESAPVTDQMTLDQSAGCLLFHTFFIKLVHNVFDDDMAVVAATTGQPFSGDPGAEIRALFFLLANPPTAGTPTFCDNVSPTLVRTPSGGTTCAEQVVTALTSAVTTLQTAYGTDTKNWLWGRVHTLTTESQLAPLIAGGFSAGPFARPGGIETVDVADPSGSQSGPLAFAYGHGSSIRFISVMDPAAANAQVKFAMPGPERDTPFRVFSSTPDLVGMYVTNTYFDFLYGHQIDNKGVSTQRFSAQ